MEITITICPLVQLMTLVLGSFFLKPALGTKSLLTKGKLTGTHNKLQCKQHRAIAYLKSATVDRSEGITESTLTNVLFFNECLWFPKCSRVVYSSVQCDHKYLCTA